MLYAEQIESLERISESVLTVYLNTQPENEGRHLLVPESLKWLRKEVKSVAQGLKAAERRHFKTQWDRTEAFLEGHHPEEKALVLFAGPDTWQLVALPIPVENEVTWGQPAISQLLLLAGRHKPYCVVVVDKTEARFLRFQFAEMTRI